MADMLVNLYELGEAFKSEATLERALLEKGIRIKRALAPDRSKVVEFAKNCTRDDYSDEVIAAFNNNPITCYIATKDKQVIGFACFEATAKNFFGPTAVSKKEHKQGIGKALLLKSLYSMQEMGYAYAIIGWPTKTAIPFYEKCVDAKMLEGKSMGVYKRMIMCEE